MGAGYDDSCPACRRPTRDRPRVGCASCASYLHDACWTGACPCGGVETLEERSGRLEVARQRAVWWTLLAAVAGGFLPLAVLSLVLGITTGRPLAATHLPLTLLVILGGGGAGLAAVVASSLLARGS